MDSPSFFVNVVLKTKDNVRPFFAKEWRNNMLLRILKPFLSDVDLGVIELFTESPFALVVFNEEKEEELFF